MENFTFTFPTKLFFGAGSRESLGKAVKQNAKRVMIVTGRMHVKESGLLDEVLENLAIRRVTTIVFDEISPNPLVSEIDEGARIAVLQNCEMILGIGGGSAMDAAKGIAIVAKNGGSILDYTSVGNFPKSSLSVALVCTLAASGSESNYWGVVTEDNSRNKIAFLSKGSQPIFSIVDPELTLSTPRKQTIDGAFDIICHVLDRYFTGKDNVPLQDSFIYSIVSTVKEYLEVLLYTPHDLNARTQLSWCSTLALCGIVQAGVEGFPTLHSLEHPITGKYNITHGRGLGILLPHYVRYQSNRSNIFKKRFCNLVQSVFKIKGDYKICFEAFTDWMILVGMDNSLKDYQIDSKDFPSFAQHIIEWNGNPLYSIPPLKKKDIISIYHSAWKGT